MKKFEVRHNIGKAKYVVSFNNGVKRHPDGSDFYDMAIFSNKKKLNKFTEWLPNCHDGNVTAREWLEYYGWNIAVLVQTFIGAKNGLNSVGDDYDILYDLLKPVRDEYFKKENIN